jgi:hypothetical protein
VLPACRRRRENEQQSRSLKIKLKSSIHTHVSWCLCRIPGCSSTTAGSLHSWRLTVERNNSSGGQSSGGCICLRSVQLLCRWANNHLLIHRCDAVLPAVVALQCKQLRGEHEVSLQHSCRIGTHRQQLLYSKPPVGSEKPLTTW